MKSSTLSRTFELAKLAARVGLKEFKSDDFHSRVEQAMLIAKSLSNLKGAAMKVGQLLSLDLDNYFPPEAIQILSQLQNAAVAQPFSEIERTILTELKSDQQKFIESISPNPIGVASIGQVHKAKYLGRDIVLKVQFAGVGHSVDSDLKILKTLASSFCQITGRKMNLDPLFQEFKTILEQELNYESEANFQRVFREKVKQLNQNSNCEYRVPEVISEISTKKVLAMSFEPGQTLRNWVSSKPKLEDKLTIATAVLDLYFHEFFDWGVVQTDPNWGNFLIDQRGSKLNLCLLDFGATRLYERQFIQNYISLLDFAANNQSRNLRELAIAIGLIDPRESASAFKAFEDMLKIAIKPFFVSEALKSTYFDFSDRHHALESQFAAKELSRELVYSPPPYSIIFLHRKLAGVYSILKNLDVKLDISSYWQMMKDLSAVNK